MYLPGALLAKLTKKLRPRAQYCLMDVIFFLATGDDKIRVF